MKMKLTTLLFGLLLAVGWTGNASAQALSDGIFTKSLPQATTMNAPAMAPNRVTGVSSVVKDKAYYQQFKYSWTDDDTGVTYTDVDPTEPATNPYQIYELLRFVYTNRYFPGPSYSAYLPSLEREDPVYYGGISGGWDIPGGTLNPVGNITITTTRSGYSGNRRYIHFHSIAVYDLDGNELTAWTCPSSGGAQFPNTWTITGATPTRTETSAGYTYAYIQAATGTITIPASDLNGATKVRVVINTRYSNSGPTLSYTVDGTTTTQAVTGTFTDYTWNISGTSTNDENYYTPYEDGYTVLVVAVNNTTSLEYEDASGPWSSHFTSKSQLIEYFRNNVDFVKLLTDGMRIGEGQGTGTVFRCDGRYNKFFFLGKGQARKKSPRILERCNNGGFYNNYGSWVTYQDWYSESVPFKEMFEQFSPTTGERGSEITDFYSKLREGNVYDVEHDCGSVIQSEHQFSLSGNEGTDYYAFSGLNFFVPDYRLLWWSTTETYNNRTYTVDGRDMKPYESTNTSTGAHGTAFVPSSTNYSYWSAYYAQYNPQYAPKVGIYRITLTAEATQVGTSHNPSNLNYNVTLTWVSSLNQMSGHDVPQTYTMYLVDENGNRTKLEPESVKFCDINGNELDENNQNPFHVTQAVYAVPQNEHSYTIEYQVDGVADAGPAFQATSNRASVVIPGWNDFVGLQLDHHESDFVITKNQQTGQSSVRNNWYRNFLAMVNEDIVNGLTVSKINGLSDDGVEMNEFGLYRFLYNDAGEPIMPGTKVATINFDQATDEQVHFTVAYQNQEIEDYDLKYKEGNQTITVADAYTRSVMGIPEEGWVRVKGNGDIVIWPNSYAVNIKSIKVYNGNNANPINGASWTAPANLPTSWYVSPGSKWENYTTDAGDQVGYMEGGGYIAIPNLLDTYPNAKVVIEAYGEAGNTNRIAVNDQTQLIGATGPGTNYTWSTPSPAAAPNRASVDQTIHEGFEDTNVFPTLSLGGITATQHTGTFGEWTIYDATGARVYGPNNLTWENKYAPQAWTPFLSTTISGSPAHNGSQYMESICPDNYNGYYDGPADSWLVSPVLSGKEQTITFWARIFTTQYTPETFEVLYTTGDIDRQDFSNSVSSFQVAASYSSATTTWTEYSATLPAGAKYFAIRHTSNDIYGLMVDDVTYQITNEVPEAQGGLLRLHLLMADQLKTDIPEDNSHPDAYGYVLKWEQPTNVEDHKQSGTVRVNIQKTDCEVMGYYTLNEIDNDKNIGSRDENGNILHDQGLTMDVLTADVEFNLSSSNDLLNYYNLQSEKDQEPSFNEDYVTKLYRQENFTYREMLETSPNLGEVYPSGEHHYFDDSTPIKTGIYGVGNKFVSYAPSVSTWGVQRRYYEYDGLDNTYGAPIWKTAVGKAELNSVTAERQTNQNNSVNWTTAAGPASLYILDGIEAEGYLPPESLTKVKFEPYMFRVFVESKNGKLRPYKTVDAVEGSATQGEHLEALVPDDQLTDAQKYGPQCVWNGYVKYNEETGAMIQDDNENGATIKPGNDAATYFIYNKNKVDRTGGSNPTPPQPSEWDKDAVNAMFGALNALTTDDKNLIIEDDLKFFVRFYFCVKGEAAGHTVGTRAESSRVGNGAESEGRSGDSATAVKEITYVGEIVSQTYFNVQGMESDKPFDGVNIVVTRFSDGTTSVSKVVR